MKGTIEAVWENETQKGQKYVTVQVNGERYSVWDDKYFAQLQNGAEIEYEIRKSGKFQHLSDIKLPGQVAENNGKDRPALSPPYRSNGDRETQITRMSCLKSASEVVAPIQVELPGKRKLVIETAKFFERYVVGETDLDFPPKEEGEALAGNGR